MAASWAFKIDDLASGPAAKMASALEGFDSKLNAADGALKSFDSKLGASASAMGKLDAEIRKANPARTLAKQSESAFGRGGFFGKLLGGGIGEAIPELYFATELGSKVVSLGESFADAAIGASKFAIAQAASKQQALASLEVMTGSAATAKDYYRTIQQLSDLTPFKQQSIQPVFTSLVGAGLKKSEVLRVTAALADIASLNPEGGDVGLAQSMGPAIIEMMATGRFNQRHMMMFANGAGGAFNMGKFYDLIAKDQGIDAESVQRKLSTGEIPAMRALYYFERYANEVVDKGKGLGSVAEKLGIEQLPGQLTTLQNRFQRLFQDIDYAPIAGALSNLNDLLNENSDSGGKLKGALDDLFGGTFKAFFAEYSGPQGAKALKKDFDSLVDSVQTLALVLEVAAATAGKLFHAAMWLYDHHALDAAMHALDILPGGAVVSGSYDALKGATALQGKIDEQRHLAQSIADAAKLNPKILNTPGTRDFLASQGIAVPLANAPTPAGSGPAIHVENHVTVPADASKEHSDAVVKAVHEATVSTLTSAMEQAAHRRGVQ